MVKYIQRRINGKPTRLYTCIGWCKTCGEPFEKIGRGSNRAYCNICAKNSARQSRREYDNKREERNEYIAGLMQKGREQGTIKKNLDGTNQQVCGKPPEDPTDRDWMEYHNKIKKMKKDVMGGYQDYYDMDEEEGNPYE